MLYCPNCGASLKDGQKFCAECGTKAPVVDKCTKCGTKLEPDFKFCYECGAPVSNITPKRCSYRVTIVDTGEGKREVCRFFMKYKAMRFSEANALSQTSNIVVDVVDTKRKATTLAKKIEALGAVVKVDEVEHTDNPAQQVTHIAETPKNQDYQITFSNLKDAIILITFSTECKQNGDRYDNYHVYTFDNGALIYYEVNDLSLDDVEVKFDRKNYDVKWSTPYDIDLYSGVEEFADEVLDCEGSAYIEAVSYEDQEVINNEFYFIVYNAQREEIFRHIKIVN